VFADFHAKNANAKKRIAARVVAVAQREAAAFADFHAKNANAKKRIAAP
jgi:hypothetical protein